jgi:hypothetical protein
MKFFDPNGREMSLDNWIKSMKKSVVEGISDKVVNAVSVHCETHNRIVKAKVVNNKDGFQIQANFCCSEAKKKAEDSVHRLLAD